MGKSIKELEAELTPQQILVAQAIVDAEFEVAMRSTTKRKTQGEIAEEFDVHRSTITRWKKNPTFVEYLGAISRQEIDAIRPLVMAQLARLIRGSSNNGIPSLKAIEIYLKMSGDLISRSESTSVTIDGTAKSEKEIAEGLRRMTDELLKGDSESGEDAPIQ